VIIRDIHDGDPNSFDVIVDEIEFLGSFARTSLSNGRGLTLTAEFSMNVMRDFKLKVGKAVKIVLPVKHLHIFAEE
jgi:hypothetical protein